MHWKNEGAYTGETSPTMLTAIGATHVLIGHSERRQYFAETDTTVNLKLKAALEHSLIPIVCVGEHLEEREANLTRSVLELQVSMALEGIDPAAAAPIVFAYEPVWAIGTGRTATPEIAAEAHKVIRDQIARSLTPELAASIRVLYGGSVKPDNAKSLCCLEDIDGALVAEPASTPSPSRRSCTTPLPATTKPHGRGTSPLGAPYPSYLQHEGASVRLCLFRSLSSQVSSCSPAFRLRRFTRRASQSSKSKPTSSIPLSAFTTQTAAS